MVSVTEKLESAEEVDSVSYDPTRNMLVVNYDFSQESVHDFSDAEIKLIREGKLTPLVGSGKMTRYDVHITIDEQRENRESNFTFV